MGKVVLPSLVPGYETFSVLVFGGAVIAISILIAKIELVDEADICQITGKKLEEKGTKPQ